MTPLEATLFGALLALPPYYREPGDTTREARFRVVAHELSGLRPAVATALIKIGQAESGFAAYVGAGCLVIPKGAPNCDGGRALGYWQLHRSTCPAAWRFPPWTIESLREQVTCAARLYQGAASRCLPANGSHSWPQAFGCVWADRTWKLAS
jgi:hypothetical protein